MKSIYIIITSIILVSACRQQEENTQNALKFEIKEYSIYSKFMEDERNHIVFSPLKVRRHEQNTPLPVLFILDGSSYYSFFNALMEQWTSKKEIVLPEMIVVSIKQNDRSTELLHSYINKKGKGELFLNYIVNELIPAIEADYNILPYRTLFGHSRGGLFAMNALIEAPELFDNYIVSDPNLVLENMAFLKKWGERKINLETHNNSLFIGLADTKEGHSLEDILNPNSNTYPHMRVIWSLCEKMEKDTIQNKHFEWKYYDGFGHNTIPPMVAMDGLLSVFNYHRLDKYGLIYGHLDGKISYAEFKQTIINHFNNVSSRFESTVYPYEDLIYEYGEIFLEEEMADKAKEMFEWNKNNFPDSNKSAEAMERFKRGLNKK